jgi:hypothetical protein
VRRAFACGARPHDFPHTSTHAFDRSRCFPGDPGSAAVRKKGAWREFKLPEILVRELAIRPRGGGIDQTTTTPRLHVHAKTRFPKRPRPRRPRPHRRASHEVMCSTAHFDILTFPTHGLTASPVYCETATGLKISRTPHKN